MNPELNSNTQSLLASSQVLFKQIYEQSPLGIVIQQGENQIVSNQAFCQMLGYTADELLQLSSFDITHPDDRSLNKKYDILLKNNQIRSYNLEKRYIHKNGEIIYATVTVSSIKESDGQIRTRIATIENTTEKKLAEFSLAEKNIELEKYIHSNANLENFAYFASHDLREPLRTTKNFTQLLRRKFKTSINEEALEYMQFITESVDHMDSLINNLLAFSKINTESSPEELIKTEQLLEFILVNLKTKMEAKNATVSYHELPPEIVGNKSQISQLFQNLISNALKFGKPNSTNHIVISCEKKESHWQFSIADQGIGIDEIYFKEVFKIFKKLHGKNSEFGKGTGIGLALCKKIIERHKGQIWVKSRAGEGTTFFFSLPIKDFNLP